MLLCVGEYQITGKFLGACDNIYHLIYLTLVRTISLIVFHCHCFADVVFPVLMIERNNRIYIVRLQYPCLFCLTETSFRWIHPIVLLLRLGLLFAVQQKDSSLGNIQPFKTVSNREYPLRIRKLNTLFANKRMYHKEYTNTWYFPYKVNTAKWPLLLSFLLVSPTNSRQS